MVGGESSMSQSNYGEIRFHSRTTLAWLHANQNVFNHYPGESPNAHGNWEREGGRENTLPIFAIRHFRVQGQFADCRKKIERTILRTAIGLAVGEKNKSSFVGQLCDEIEFCPSLSQGCWIRVSLLFPLLGCGGPSQMLQMTNISWTQDARSGRPTKPKVTKYVFQFRKSSATFLFDLQNSKVVNWFVLNFGLGKKSNPISEKVCNVWERKNAEIILFPFVALVSETCQLQHESFFSCHNRTQRASCFEKSVHCRFPDLDSKFDFRPW